MKRSCKGQPVLANGRAVAGIDIGKRKHAATALSPQGEMIAQLASFPNTREGIDRLEKEVFLKAGGPGKVLVAMEATGHYWMCLYAELTRRKYDCVALNPIQTGSRQAEQVAEDQLRSIFDYLDTLEGQIATIEEELGHRVEKLASPLPSLGISSVLAAVIHAESDPISDFANADQYVAYTGLDPSLRESGDSIHWHGKISKRGSPVLRQALFLAAFAIYRKHVYFHRIYLKHRRQGKQHNNALVIVARHLARVVWRMLTDGREFSKRPPKKAGPSANGQRKPK